MKKSILVSLLASSLFSFAARAGSDFDPDPGRVARGRYVTRTTGCNDCHSPGYSESNGTLPEAQWLKGSTTGYRGPWGTSYPVNLRHLFANMSESQWLQYAKTFRALPPMPWYNVHAMTRDDLRAIYHFIRYLGDDNTQIPEPLPPGVAPTTPYINFVPVNPGT